MFYIWRHLPFALAAPLPERSSLFRPLGENAGFSFDAMEQLAYALVPAFRQSW